MRGNRLQVADKIAQRMFDIIYKRYAATNSRFVEEKLQDKNWVAHQRGKYRKTRKICSCSFCGNPRKNGHKSYQELRAPGIGDWVNENR